MNQRGGLGVSSPWKLTRVLLLGNHRLRDELAAALRQAQARVTLALDGQEVCHDQQSRLLRGNLADDDYVYASMEGHEVCFWLAEAEEEPQALRRSQLAFLHLIEAARRYQVARFALVAGVESPAAALALQRQIARGYGHFYGLEIREVDLDQPEQVAQLLQVVGA